MVVGADGDLLRGVELRLAGLESLGDVEDGDLKVGLILELLAEGLADPDDPAELVEARALMERSHSR